MSLFVHVIETIRHVAPEVIGGFAGYFAHELKRGLFRKLTRRS